MAKKSPSKRTEKSKYPSRYSPKKWVTAAQFIIELVCENKAMHDKSDIPVQFWNLPEWSSFYRSQLRRTHALLKKYDESSIIHVVKKNRVRTLFPKWIETLISERQKVTDLRKAQRQVEQKDDDEPIIDSKPRKKRFGKGLDSLFNID